MDKRNQVYGCVPLFYPPLTTSLYFGLHQNLLSLKKIAGELVREKINILYLLYFECKIGANSHVKTHRNICYNILVVVTDTGHVKVVRFILET